MPFSSEAQRRYLWAKHPKLAKRWADEYPGQHDLPEHKRKSSKRLLKKSANMTLSTHTNHLPAAMVKPNPAEHIHMPEKVALPAHPSQAPPASSPNQQIAQPLPQPFPHPQAQTQPQPLPPQFPGQMKVAQLPPPMPQPQGPTTAQPPAPPQQAQPASTPQGPQGQQGPGAFKPSPVLAAAEDPQSPLTQQIAMIEQAFVPQQPLPTRSEDVASGRQMANQAALNKIPMKSASHKISSPPKLLNDSVLRQLIKKATPRFHPMMNQGMPHMMPQHMMGYGAMQGYGGGMNQMHPFAQQMMMQRMMQQQMMQQQMMRNQMMMGQRQQMLGGMAGGSGGGYPLGGTGSNGGPNQGYSDTGMASFGGRSGRSQQRQPTIGQPPELPPAMPATSPVSAPAPSIDPVHQRAYDNWTGQHQAFNQFQQQELDRQRNRQEMAQANSPTATAGGDISQGIERLTGYNPGLGNAGRQEWQHPALANLQNQPYYRNATPEQQQQMQQQATQNYRMSGQDIQNLINPEHASYNHELHGQLQGAYGQDAQRQAQQQFNQHLGTAQNYGQQRDWMNRFEQHQGAVQSHNLGSGIASAASGLMNQAANWLNSGGSNSQPAATAQGQTGQPPELTESNPAPQGQQPPGANVAGGPNGAGAGSPSTPTATNIAPPQGQPQDPRLAQLNQQRQNQQQPQQQGSIFSDMPGFQAAQTQPQGTTSAPPAQPAQAQPEQPAATTPTSTPGATPGTSSPTVASPQPPTPGTTAPASTTP